MPPPPYTHYLKTPELRKSHGPSWRWLVGGSGPQDPLDAAAPAYRPTTQNAIINNDDAAADDYDDDDGMTVRKHLGDRRSNVRLR